MKTARKRAAEAVAMICTCSDECKEDSIAIVEEEIVSAINEARTTALEEAAKVAEIRHSLWEDAARKKTPMCPICCRSGAAESLAEETGYIVNGIRALARKDGGDRNG